MQKQEYLHEIETYQVLVQKGFFIIIQQLVEYKEALYRNVSVSKLQIYFLAYFCSN